MSKLAFESIMKMPKINNGKIQDTVRLLRTRYFTASADALLPLVNR